MPVQFKVHVDQNYMIGHVIVLSVFFLFFILSKIESSLISHDSSVLCSAWTTFVLSTRRCPILFLSQQHPVRSVTTIQYRFLCKLHLYD